MIESEAAVAFTLSTYICIFLLLKKELSYSGALKKSHGLKN